MNRRKPKTTAAEFLKKYIAEQASLSPQEKLSEEVLEIIMNAASNEDLWSEISPDDAGDD